MTTMQAVRVHQFGSPEQLQLETIPRPEPKDGEILVRVYAAGVLPMDCYMRAGGFTTKPLPYIPGTAFAGVVEAVGTGVTDFQSGQAICGRAPQGTYAEYTTILVNPPAPDPNQLLHQMSANIIPLVLKPASLTFEEAATLSGGATTAWTSVIEDGGLQAGQRALIHGAAGGVGLFAVQFAKWKGAHIIGTASTANVDFVYSLGAETVVDYTQTPFEEVAQDLDFVLDTIGGDTMIRSMKALKRGGTLISVVDEPPADLALELGIQLIDTGHLRPTIQQTFSLDEAHLAHALCETGHGRGRIVLSIP
jgi:NADPH:quinone reductase-like Zn-dependent oxidoreductase